jgi:DNA-binding LacI/PurR family transcriptional regulator
LTTIDQHIDQLGYIGTKVLVDMIHRRPLPSEIQHIETNLVVRGTTCA